MELLNHNNILDSIKENENDPLQQLVRRSRLLKWQKENLYERKILIEKVPTHRMVKFLNEILLQGLPLAVHRHIR